MSESAYLVPAIGLFELLSLATKTPQTPSTPPPTEDEEPKIPHSVSTIIEAIRWRKDGKPRRPFGSQSWVSFPLSVADFGRLQRVLRRDVSLWPYVQDKLRYDYFPTHQRFVLRMPSHLHELFIVSVVKDIDRQLAQVATVDSPSADFARNVKHCGTADIRPLDPDYGLHSPDASYQHLDAQIPGVVIEVSYTQKRLDLKRLADDYILGSDQNVRVVVGLDVQYNGREAVLSVWRPEVGDDEDGKPELRVKQVVKDQIFRDSDGHAIADSASGLDLGLEDFANELVLQKYHHAVNGQIHLSASALCAYLNFAEEQHLQIKENRGLTTLLPYGLKKRRRQGSPPNEILLAHEPKISR